MNLEFMSSVMLFTARITGVFIFLYYIGLELLSLILILKSSIIRFVKYLKQKRRNIKWPNIKDLYQRSLIFNHGIAIGVIILFAYLLSQISDISTFTKIEIFTIIVSVLPYVFSFTRATNVGINGGIVGTIVGLILFSATDPSINWWDKAAYFLIITGLANVSGWIGGWVGPGQLREAVSATVFKVKMNKEGVTLSSLVETVSEAIDEIIPVTNKENLFSDQKPNLVIAQGDTSFSIVSYKHELEWKQSIRPQKIALKWLFDKNEYSSNIIIDYVFNIFRAKVTKITLVSRQPPPQSTISQGIIYLIILCYKETPSIVWVDEEVENLSHVVRERVENALKHEDKQNEDVDWKISSPEETIVRQWLPKIKLEQYSKNTIGANMPYEVIKEEKIGKKNKFPLEVLDEIIKTPTAYDKFRGNAFAFVSFLFFQVFIGITINILSTMIGP